MVAEMIRTSTLRVREPSPTGSNSPSWSTRSSLTCRSSGSSPISSRKSVPPCARAKRPSRRSVAPGERALLVPEELALDEVRRDRGRVEAHERLGAPRAAGVDGARDQLLARARLSEDQDARIRRGDLVDLAKDVPQAGTLAEDAFEPFALVDLVLERADAFLGDVAAR